MTTTPFALPDYARTPDDMLLDAYDFTLPESHIARRPLTERTASRLLHVPAEGPGHHRMFTDLLDLLDEGDCLVMNDTAVLPARLLAEKAETGGKVEVLLCREDDDGSWVALLKASKKPKPGTRLVFGGDLPVSEHFFATVEGRVDDEDGCWRLHFEGDARKFALHAGHVPIPPYFERDDDDDDKERYQTVYANPNKVGAAAAPTAGFHFDDAFLQKLDDKGVQRAMVTLHVGPGTFMPVRADHLADHEMHAEPWELSSAVAEKLNATRKAGKRIIAVGTTSLRTLETAVDDNGVFYEGRGLSRIFLHPGKPIRSVDALFTNFHLPKSSLLMLVAALVGRERIVAAYDEAIAHNYRFYSYGDASLLEVNPAVRRLI